LSLEDRCAPKSIKELCCNIPVTNYILRHIKKFYPMGSPLGEAILLVGPAGVGKTSLAHLVGKYNKMYVKEYNASDVRNKKIIMDTLHVEVQLRHHKKTLFVIDEIDGLTKEGQQAMVKVIEAATSPVILISNNQYKVRTIAKHCTVFNIEPPTHQAMYKRLKVIIKDQQINITDRALKGLIVRSMGDLRNCIKRLEFVSMNIEGQITLDSIKKLSSQKDVFYDSPFEAAKLMFHPGKKNPFRIVDKAFCGNEHVIATLVQNNYLLDVKHREQRKPKTLKALSEAADYICHYDEIGYKVPKEYAALALRGATHAVEGICEKRQRLKWSATLTHSANNLLRDIKHTIFYPIHDLHVRSIVFDIYEKTLFKPLVWRNPRKPNPKLEEILQPLIDAPIKMSHLETLYMLRKKLSKHGKPNNRNHRTERIPVAAKRYLANKLLTEKTNKMKGKKLKTSSSQNKTPVKKRTRPPNQMISEPPKKKRKVVKKSKVGKKKKKGQRSLMEWLK